MADAAPKPRAGRALTASERAWWARLVERELAALAGPPPANPPPLRAPPERSPEAVETPPAAVALALALAPSLRGSLDQLRDSLDQLRGEVALLRQEASRASERALATEAVAAQLLPVMTSLLGLGPRAGAPAQARALPDAPEWAPGECSTFYVELTVTPGAE